MAFIAVLRLPFIALCVSPKTKKEYSSHILANREIALSVSFVEAVQLYIIFPQNSLKGNNLVSQIET